MTSLCRTLKDSIVLQDQFGGGRYYFYYQSFIIVNEEKYLYDFLKVASEFGSYVGVLLGVSLLDVVAILKKILRTSRGDIEE